MSDSVVRLVIHVPQSACVVLGLLSLRLGQERNDLAPLHAICMAIHPENVGLPTIGLGGFVPRPPTMQIQRPLARFVIGNEAAIIWIAFLGEIPIAVPDGDHFSRLLDRALLLWTISVITPKHPQAGLGYSRLRTPAIVAVTHEVF